MNAMNLYINACRLVMQADPTDRDTFAELYNLLPILHQSLKCTVCCRILVNPFTPMETSCQHHVCEMCIGGKKRLRPSCSWCKDYETYSKNSQMKIIIQCYKKLCTYIKATMLYKMLSTIINNGCTYNLAELIDEVASVAIEDGKLQNKICSPKVGLIEKHAEIRDSNIESILGLESSIDQNNMNESENINSNLEPKVEVLESDMEFRNQELLSPKKDNCISPLLTVDSSVISTSPDPNSNINDFPNILVSEVPISIPLSNPLGSPISQSIVNGSELLNSPPELSVSFSSPILTTSVSMSTDTQFKDESLSEFGVESSSNNQEFSPIYSTCINLPEVPSTPVDNNIELPIPSSLASVDILDTDYQTNLGLSISPSPSVSISHSNLEESINIEPITSYDQVSSNISNNIVPCLPELQSFPTVTNSSFSRIINIQPSTICPNINSKSNTQESYIKHGTQLNNNGSSLYSIMQSNNDSTKITIKRKPSDLENIKKSPMDKEKLIIGVPSHEMKKPRPKSKPKPKRKGCRCGNATPTPGKLTCCGQRCPCYVEAKACIDCQCRGCRNSHRPGGKKVRPIIPQVGGNIQIHQIQPVHQRLPTMPGSNVANFHQMGISNMAAHNITNSGNVPQTIRAVHAMHAVQAVQGLGQIHTVPSGMHQFINIGSGINMNSELKLKPVNFALSPLPTQLLIHDEKTNTSDTSDIDIDI